MLLLLGGHAVCSWRVITVSHAAHQRQRRHLKYVRALCSLTAFNADPLATAGGHTRLDIIGAPEPEEVWQTSLRSPLPVRELKRMQQQQFVEHRATINWKQRLGEWPRRFVTFSFGQIDGINASEGDLAILFCAVTSGRCVARRMHAITALEAW